MEMIEIRGPSEGMVEVIMPPVGIEPPRTIIFISNGELRFVGWSTHEFRMLRPPSKKIIAFAKKKAKEYLKKGEKGL